MVGGAIFRRLTDLGHSNVIVCPRKDLDLRDQGAVRTYFAETSPGIVIVAAAKVGGIHANDTYPAEFIHDNLAIGLNVIQAAHESGVKRLLFLGSSCIYPKSAPQPIPESSLLTGSLEPTNEAYAIAKIAILKMCQFYRRQYGDLFHAAMPCNLYGPGDNYHPENSHVIPGLIRRFHQAKMKRDSAVKIWGTGTPSREFLFVDDLAEACLHLLELENPPDLINIGFGKDVKIIELAELIAEVIGFEGEILCDESKPDGVARKLMDSSLVTATGWKPKTPLAEGLQAAYSDFLANHKTDTTTE
ncbi:UNVERIFIED_CONTAM: hypothetical protein GTU68_004663 [Idotea baltica]|nr:hypothetical protein [Idotea baltica]